MILGSDALGTDAWGSLGGTSGGTTIINAVMSAFETNSDILQVVINMIQSFGVIQSQPAVSAKVSIVEVSSGNSVTSVGES